MADEQHYYQRLYGIGATARIEVTWDTDAYRLIFAPVRMTGHNAVNQLGEQMVQFPRRSPWVGTREVIAVMLRLYRDDLAALRHVDPAFVQGQSGARARAKEPRGRGPAQGKRYGEGPCGPKGTPVPNGQPFLTPGQARGSPSRHRSVISACPITSERGR